jgi:cytochrome c oxidase assembly protein subunit 15
MAADPGKSMTIADSPFSAVHPTAPALPRKQAGAAVRVWLWSVAALVFLMVVVGGAVRLTESGLSITEWQPISGIIPPLNPAAWQLEFDHYKAIPQYARLFPDMDLARFEVIFYWEWAHRLLGRVIGLVMAVPLIWFWLSSRLTGKLKWQLAGVLALGGLQGFVGWWMVSSGLADRVEVAPQRLATHLVLAALTLVALVAVATRLEPRSTAAAPARLRHGASLLIVVVLVQSALGALVAGARAGRIDNTWPLIEGHFVPPLGKLFGLSPVWRNFLENATTVQFDHRVMADFVFAVAILLAFDAVRSAPGSAAARRALVLAGLVICTAGLGIATLVLVVPLGLALAHQAFALAVLAMAARHRACMTGRALLPLAGAL